MTNIIDMDDYDVRTREGADDLAGAMGEALAEVAESGTPTYFRKRGITFAAITLPEAAERHEHATMVEISPRLRMATVPVVVRTEPRHRRARSRRLGWPFKDFF